MNNWLKKNPVECPECGVHLGNYSLGGTLNVTINIGRVQMLCRHAQQNIQLIRACPHVAAARSLSEQLAGQQDQ